MKLSQHPWYFDVVEFLVSLFFLIAAGSPRCMFFRLATLGKARLSPKAVDSGFLPVEFSTPDPVNTESEHNRSTL